MINPRHVISFKRETYEVYSPTKGWFSSTSIKVLVSLVYIKHIKSFSTVLIHFTNPHPNQVIISKKLLSAKEYIKKIGCWLLMESTFHQKIVDQLMLDLNFDPIKKPTKHCQAYLHRNKKVSYEYYKKDYDPYPSLTYNSCDGKRCNEATELKECYLGEVFKFQTKCLGIKACSFYTLYQYIP